MLVSASFSLGMQGTTYGKKIWHMPRASHSLAGVPKLPILPHIVPFPAAGRRRAVTVANDDPPPPNVCGRVK